MRRFVFLIVASCSFSAFATNLIFGKPAFTRHFANPEDAIKPWKPVITTVEANYANKINKFFVTETNWFYEGSTINLSLYSKNGVIETEFPSALGPFIYSSKEKTLLFCENDGYEGNYSAKLFTLDGALLKELPALGWSRDCGKSGDDTIYWQRYSEIIEGTATSIIRFIDTTGKLISTIRSTSEENVTLDHNGSVYTFYFDMPNYPG